MDNEKLLKQFQQEQQESIRAEKEARFKNLLERKEELVARYQRMFETGEPVGDDMFMEMEISVEKAAHAALDAGNRPEFERLMAEHKDIMRWRFGENA